jgi:Outer membrane protein beta-barrel domain
MKTIVLFIYFFNGNNPVSFCQKATETTQKSFKPFVFYSNGGYGKYFTTDKPIQLSNSGNIYFFQLQVNYKQNYFARFAFDQYSIDYSDNAIINGLLYKIKNKTQTTNVGMDLGYTVRLSKKVSSFAYLGIGRAVMHVPTIHYDTATGVDISLVKKPFLSLRGGVGCEYKFDELFILYVDMQYLTIPFKAAINNKQLSGASFQIGFKTKLF